MNLELIEMPEADDASLRLPTATTGQHITVPLIFVPPRTRLQLWRHPSLVPGSGLRLLPGTYSGQCPDCSWSRSDTDHPPGCRWPQMWPSHRMQRKLRRFRRRWLRSWTAQLARRRKVINIVAPVCKHNNWPCPRLEQVMFRWPAGFPPVGPWPGDAHVCVVFRGSMMVLYNTPNDRKWVERWRVPLVAWDSHWKVTTFGEANP